MTEREKEIELMLLDRFLEHRLKEMEEQKEDIEDINYLYTKCVAIPNIKEVVRPCK